PYYLGSAFMPAYRALLIGGLLRQKNRHSPEDMIEMQGDALSIPARETIPNLVQAVKEAGESDDLMKVALVDLSNWYFVYGETSVAATIYDTWFRHFIDYLWSSRFPDRTQYLYPPLERTIALITNEAHSKWFDDPRTEKREELGDIARKSLVTTLDEL